MRIVTVCVLLSFALLSPPAVATEENHAPLVVASAEVTDVYTVVAWLPGAEVAESFRVYGIVGNAPEFLGEVKAQGEPTEMLSAVVPSGFSNYAVSGVKNGAESPLVYSVTADGPPCILIDPPTIGIHCNPLERGDISVRIEIM